MKIGIDFHGVIKESPKFFSEFTKAMLAFNHEIHIITGSKEKDISAFLFKHKIGYTHFYSITDNLLENKFDYVVDEHGRPQFVEGIWETQKAWYCLDNKIDMMLDDSDVYGKYFVTPYCKWEGVK